MNPLRFTLGFLLSAFGVMLVSCTDGRSQAMSDVRTSRFCDYGDFSADITAGPSAGLRLAGPLILEEDLRTGSLAGTLRNQDGTLIPVSGSVYKSGDIALLFHAKSGYVMGLGKLGDNFCKPGTTLTGIAIGPRVDANSMIGQSDTGHWVLSSAYLNYDPITITASLEPSDPSLVTYSTADNPTTASVKCVQDATQVSPSCCSGKVGTGGTATTCMAGGVTCTTTRSNNFTTADLCCDGAKMNSTAPDCASGTSKIQQ